MGVIAVDPILGDRRGSDDVRRIRRYVRSFRVRTDDPRDDVATVGAASGLPRLFDRWRDLYGTEDRNVYLETIDVSPDQSDECLWQVDCSYTSELFGEKAQQILGAPSLDNPNPPEMRGDNSTRPTQDQQVIEDPTKRPMTISYATEHHEEVVYYGYDASIPAGGTPVYTAIRNSAGQLFQQPIKRDVPRVVMTITRNLPKFNPDTITEFVGKVNSSSLFGMAAKRLLCKELSAELGFENNIGFWRATCKLHIAPRGETWAYKVVDNGLSELINGQLVPIRDSVTGTLISSPVLLNGAGRKATGSTPTLLTFDVLPEVNLRTMPIFAS